jgi:hypothetical protein
MFTERRAGAGAIPSRPASPGYGLCTTRIASCLTPVGYDPKRCAGDDRVEPGGALSGRLARASSQAREERPAEHDVVGELRQLAGLYNDAVGVEGLGERVPVVGLHLCL